MKADKEYRLFLDNGGNIIAYSPLFEDEEEEPSAGGGGGFVDRSVIGVEPIYVWGPATPVVAVITGDYGLITASQMGADIDTTITVLTEEGTQATYNVNMDTIPDELSDDGVLEAYIAENAAVGTVIQYTIEEIDNTPYLNITNVLNLDNDNNQSAIAKIGNTLQYSARKSPAEPGEKPFTQNDAQIHIMAGGEDFSTPYNVNENTVAFYYDVATSENMGTGGAYEGRVDFNVGDKLFDVKTGAANMYTLPDESIHIQIYTDSSNNIKLILINRYLQPALTPEPVTDLTVTTAPLDTPEDGKVKLTITGMTSAIGDNLTYYRVTDNITPIGYEVEDAFDATGWILYTADGEEVSAADGSVIQAIEIDSEIKVVKLGQTENPTDDGYTAP